MKTALIIMLYFHPVTDSIPLKLSYQYDSTRWKILPMTKQDSLFIKSITTNGIKRLSKRNSKMH